MIICAAIKDKRTNAVFGGIRHSDIYSALHDICVTRNPTEVIEGFLDNKNHFLDRHEAFEVAVACGQVSASVQEQKNKDFETELYSEDLY